VRDQEGYDQLRASGIRLGENPYDFYTLETAEDVLAVRDLLKRHRDSTGRSACLVMNFLLANLDFTRLQGPDARHLRLRPLTEGWPGRWSRPGLFAAYRQGIHDAVFYPALQGLTQFSTASVEKALEAGGERAGLLRTLWSADTPFIHWRMPWVGYEYFDPEGPREGFLQREKQIELVERAAEIFTSFFSTPPFSACAPGYRANDDTHLAWAKCGVRVVHNGRGASLPPHLDEREMLNLYRTIDIEPSQRELSVEKYVQLAEACFARGVPAIVSVHSINFHSSLKDFRGPTLEILDRFLSALEAKYPNLLYVHDGDLSDLVHRGKFRGKHGLVAVRVVHEAGTHPVA
jgi:hypothetical protein